MAPCRFLFCLDAHCLQRSVPKATISFSWRRCSRRILLDAMGDCAGANTPSCQPSRTCKHPRAFKCGDLSDVTFCGVACCVQSFNPDTVSAIAFFCVAGLAGLSMVFTLVFGLYGTVGGTIYVAAKAANNARLEVRAFYCLWVWLFTWITQTLLRYAPCLNGLQSHSFRVGWRGRSSPVHRRPATRRWRIRWYGVRRCKTAALGMMWAVQPRALLLARQHHHTSDQVYMSPSCIRGVGQCRMVVEWKLTKYHAHAHIFAGLPNRKVVFLEIESVFMKPSSHRAIYPPGRRLSGCAQLLYSSLAHHNLRDAPTPALHGRNGLDGSGSG